MSKLSDAETDRATLVLMVMRPEPGNSQERMNELIAHAIECGLRWTDLADYLDRDDMPELATMLDTYAREHGLPLLGSSG